MRIIADENMPLATELFAGLGEVVRRPGRQLTAADVRTADALLVRSVTRVDAALLAGSSVRFVGTATIGTDHLDLPWLATAGITVASAPGCNARAVAEYVAAVLARLAVADGGVLAGRTLGVVGLGNVGRQVVAIARVLGLRVLGCDPWVQLPGVPSCSLEQILAEADAVTLHVPLVRGGEHPTWHLLDAARLARLRPGAWLINTGRGDVVDNAALRQLLPARPDLRVALDVWEGEPRIDAELAAQVQIATPHIAGYSQEGKWRGTQMVYEAFCRHLGVAPVRDYRRHVPGVASEVAVSPPHDGDALRVVATVMEQAAGPGRDDADLRQSLRTPDPGEAFDHLRKGHWPRREFSATPVAVAGLSPVASALLADLGFHLI